MAQLYLFLSNAHAKETCKWGVHIKEFHSFPDRSLCGDVVTQMPLVSNDCVAFRFQIRFDVKEKEDEVLLGLTQKTGRGDETVDKKTTIGFTIVRVSNGAVILAMR